MTALQHQQLLAQTKVSAINSALGLKIAAKANPRNRNTCAPAYPNPCKRTCPATCQRQTLRIVFLGIFAINN